MARFTLSIADDVASQLDAHAAEHNLNRSQTAEHIFRSYFQHLAADPGSEDEENGAGDAAASDEQAVEMSDMILAKSDVDQRVLDLAQQIKDAQGPEIETMQGWLQEWGLPSPDPSMGGMDGMDHGGGMMSEEDMTALESATGVEATRLFLQGMIEHHNGAIMMAEMELSNGQNPDVLELAQQVIDGQKAEVTTMQEILDSL